ncbi:MAG: hypothetical protein ACTSRH_16595 [Promethearchaeota archaeon]
MLYPAPTPPQICGLNYKFAIGLMFTSMVSVQVSPLSFDLGITYTVYLFTLSSILRVSISND